MKIKELHGMGIFYPEGYKRNGPRVTFSLKAWKKILKTVGKRPPESGGFLFSVKDYYLIDTFEFDKNGSDRASSVVYSPDITWANEVYEKHISNNDRFRVLVGCIHSHPGTNYEPSGESSYGSGDIVYVRKFFDYIPYLKEFFLPILVFFPGSFPVIVPWICKKNCFGIKLCLAREVSVLDLSSIPYELNSRTTEVAEKEKKTPLLT